MIFTPACHRPSVDALDTSTQVGSFADIVVFATWKYSQKQFLIMISISIIESG